MIEIIYTLFLNALPIIILVVPLLFLYKKTVGKLYFRIVIGIVVFYLIYWVLPIIFQIGVRPNKLVVQEGDEGNIALGVSFLIVHFISLISLFILYPLVTLPFIFCVAPIISFIIVWNRLRTEDGTIKENLMNLTYEFSQSPSIMIKDALKTSNWAREKQILKLMIVLLPISLYLLQVILKISGLQAVSLTEGSTALGWFLEILFVYLAIFIFSIELLFSSQVALKGRYFGENLRDQVYKSLYQVGTPISILSIILFLIEYTDSIGIIIYFFAYFIMASIIFVLFIDIFEPISILLFVKLINWWRNKGIKEKGIKKSQKDYTNFYYAIIYGAVGFIVYFILTMLISSFLIVPALGRPDKIILDSGKYIYENPTLFNSLRFDLVIISGIALEIAPIIILAIFFAMGLKYLSNSSIGFYAYIPIMIILSLLLSIPAEYWLTGQVSYTDVFGFNFFTLRTTSFDASLSVDGKVTLLGILAFPYVYARYIFCITFLSLLFFYIGKDFKIKNIPIDEKIVEKSTFSNIDFFISTRDYKEGKTRYLITKNKDVEVKSSEQEREEVQSLLNQLDEDMLLEKLKPKEEDKKEFERFYYTLKYLFNNKQIKMWKSEFGYSFERVEKQGLYLMYTDGRDVFNYPFKKGETQDPALISGMFSAITSFIQETTHATQRLNTIDHGDITIMIEYGKFIFGALFIKGKQSAEVRAQMKEFINEFEKKHSRILADWNGALMPFRNDHLLVEEIFTKD